MKKSLGCLGFWIYCASVPWTVLAHDHAREGEDEAVGFVVLFGHEVVFRSGFCG